jgi:hypothetical protein
VEYGPRMTLFQLQTLYNEWDGKMNTDGGYIRICKKAIKACFQVPALHSHGETKEAKTADSRKGSGQGPPSITRCAYSKPLGFRHLSDAANS